MHCFFTFFSVDVQEPTNLEFLEGLLVARSLRHLESVEFDGFGKGSTFSDGCHIAKADVPKNGDTKKLIRTCHDARLNLGCK